MMRPVVTDRPLVSQFLQVMWVVVGLLHLAALPIQIMEIDAAQYASISREMWEGGSWLEVKHLGADYLDKPPLLFWTAALSMGLFGFNPIAYKLPALLFAMLGVYSTYRLTRRYYTQESAQLAALILAGCLYTFKSTNDVRTDTHLMGAVAFASWQLLAYWDHRRWLHLLGAGAGIAIAMLAKGPIGLIVPASGLFVHLLQQKSWKSLADWRLWVVPPVVIGLLLTPMLVGLYWQWGSQGPYFFFWKQSFGRITGESEWVSDGGFSLFFFYSLLWMFLPFTPLLLAGLVRASRRFWSLPEGFSLGAFLLPFLALSFSRYKLDHYIYVCFPFAAILTAGYVTSLSERALIRWRWSLWVQWAGLTGLFIWIATWMFERNYAGWVGLAVLPVLGVWGWQLRGSTHLRSSLLGVLLFSVVVIGLVLGTALYPKLLRFQSQSFIREDIESVSDAYHLIALNNYSHTLDFQFHGRLSAAATTEEVSDQLRTSQRVDTWVYTDEAGYQSLMKAGLAANLQSDSTEKEVFFVYPHFHVARMNLQFINPATRAKVLEKRYLLRLPRIQAPSSTPLQEVE